MTPEHRQSEEHLMSDDKQELGDTEWFRLTNARSIRQRTSPVRQSILVMFVVVPWLLLLPGCWYLIRYEYGSDHINPSQLLYS